MSDREFVQFRMVLQSGAMAFWAARSFDCDSGEAITAESQSMMRVSHGGILEQIPQKLQTFAMRICSNVLIWRDSFSASRFRLAGKRASADLSLVKLAGNQFHHMGDRFFPVAGSQGHKIQRLEDLGEAVILHEVDEMHLWGVVKG